MVLTPITRAIDSMASRRSSSQQPPRPEHVGTLDELGDAARDEDLDRYRTAMHRAERPGPTHKQTRSAYQWGRLGLGPAPFDEHGNLSN